MLYSHLREELQKFFSKYPGLEWKKPVSVINDAFPGTFNLSFNEPEHLELFGSYIDYPRPLLFGKIQPVIRYNDFLEKIIPGKDTYKYLGLFDMGGISLSYPDNKNLKKVVEQIIELGFQFLIENLCLDCKKLFIKLSNGGMISDITRGKYTFNKKILPDFISIEKWSKLGINEKQIIFDSSRDTFLSLYLFGRPSPWGYRTEILYDIGKGTDPDNLLDIGTIEYLPWRPVIKNGEIIDIIENSSFNALIVFGLERLLLVKNSLNHIVECDHILPLYQKIVSDSKIPKSHEHFLLTEALRVVHRILIDKVTYNKNLKRHRRKKLKHYLTVIADLFYKLNIKKEKIIDYLVLNSELNKFYPELKNIDLIIEEINF